MWRKVRQRVICSHEDTLAFTPHAISHVDARVQHAKTLMSIVPKLPSSCGQMALGPICWQHEATSRDGVKAPVDLNTGELGPVENSAQAKTRPQEKPRGEPGPTENSAPHYRGELGRSLKCFVRPTWLYNVRTLHHCIHFHTQITYGDLIPSVP